MDHPRGSVKWASEISENMICRSSNFRAFLEEEAPDSLDSSFMRLLEHLHVHVSKTIPLQSLNFAQFQPINAFFASYNSLFQANLAANSHTCAIANPSCILVF